MLLLEKLLSINSNIGQAISQYLYAVGLNASGRLGDGTTTHRSSPVQIGSLTDWNKIDAGLRHSHAIKTDGTLWSWGFNSQGQLGLGDRTHRPSPVQVGSLTGWSEISAGDDSTLSLKTDGTLWAWGDNINGQLGDGTITHRSSPVQVGFLSDWKSISVFNHSLAVKNDGTLWAWGLNNHGQLGDGTRTHRSSPVQIGSLTNWSQVTTGYLYSLAIKTDGTLWSWGNNSFLTGQFLNILRGGWLGDSSRTHRSSPVQVGSLTDWSQIAAGERHSIAVKTDGTLWSWGFNSQGQLATSTTTADRSSPVQIGSLTNWSKISACGDSCLALKTDGTLWSWGDNTSGQLGDGTRTHRSSPVQVGSLSDWKSISSGELFNLMLKS